MPGVEIVFDARCSRLARCQVFGNEGEGVHKPESVEKVALSVEPLKVACVLPTLNKHKEKTGTVEYTNSSCRFCLYLKWSVSIAQHISTCHG